VKNYLERVRQTDARNPKYLKIVDMYQKLGKRFGIKIVRH